MDLKPAEGGSYHSKTISSKVNFIVGLEIDLAYYDCHRSAVYPLCHGDFPMNNERKVKHQKQVKGVYTLT